MELLPSRTSMPPGHFGEVIALDNLHGAWRKVRSNRGGPGGDGITLDIFEREADISLARLAAALTKGQYRPGPLRRFRVPKKSGGSRELAVPCVIDRVAQTAVLLVLTPILDGRMANESFAYRPGRSVAQALALARAMIGRGLAWVVDADIERLFDSVPHGPLLHDLTIWLDDPSLLGLIALWLRVFAAGGRGLPQGAPLSPLLANLYLHPLDRILAAAGITAVRYADDFILVCTSREDAERAGRITAGVLADRGLKLCDRKTRIVQAATGFAFLGEIVCGPTTAQDGGSRPRPVPECKYPPPTLAGEGFWLFYHKHRMRRANEG